MSTYSIAQQTENCKQLQKYFLLINQAELSICNKQWGAASRLYQNAFKKVERPFNRDLKKAMYIDYKFTDKIKNAEKYAAILARRGFEQYLDRDTLYLDNFQRIVDVFSKTKTQINKKLCSSIDSLSAQDQYIRNTPCFENRNDSCLRLVTMLDSINMNSLFTLIKNEQIDEESIGFRIVDAWFIIHHNGYFQTHSASLSATMQILNDGAKNGIIDPRNYTSFSDDLAYSHGPGDTAIYGTVSFFYIINDTLYVEAPPIISNIDQNRKNYYLESYDDMIRKVIFQFQFDDWNLNFYTNHHCVGLSDDEIAAIKGKRGIRIITH
jgi:hypothetical protein